MTLNEMLDTSRVRRGKRTFDLILGTLALIVMLPVLAAIGLLVLVLDGRPVIFRQQRVGFRGVPFCILKFRTMVTPAGGAGGTLTVGRDQRITRLGHWLRKFKLDELPQLVNVVKGEMSFVGPRPELQHYVAQYSAEQRRILDLVPGITDPSSIAFRDESGILASYRYPEQAYIQEIMPRKIRLSLAYAERATLASDLWVILRTLGALWR